MTKPLKWTLVVILAVLMAASGTLLAITLTHPKQEYDPSKVKLDVSLDTRDQVLTCAYKVYGDNNSGMWVAKTLIKNTGTVPVYDFKIDYMIKGYTDWTSGEEYPVIIPGQTVRDCCWPNLDGDKVKQLTTKTPVEVVMRFTYKGKDRPAEDFEKVYLLGKNDFVFSSLQEDDQATFVDRFDNYPFLASFITPNEETVKKLANEIAGGKVTRLSDQDAYNALTHAFNTLRAMGVKYIMEPAAFWSGSEGQYVQYPKETIERKSGTCLDLAILFSALMEAVGVRSYIALIPGHAIPVIQLPESGDLVPIESTFVDRDFTLSHYPGVTSAEVTAEECVPVADQNLANQKQAEVIMIDPETIWKNGVMPTW